MRTPGRSGRRARITAALTATGLLALFAAPEATAQQRLSGRMAAIWEDPLPGRGEPRLRHFLATDDGDLVSLHITEAQLHALGGPLESSGRYVVVSGAWRTVARRPGATGSRELDVSAVRPSTSPLASRAFAQQGVPITGSHPWITVLCRFADSPTVEPHALSWYEGLMGSVEPGVDHYWRELSFDQANVAGSAALGWYDLPQPRSHYVDDAAQSANLPLLKEDCAAAADADIHFPDYVGINLQFNEGLGGFSWGGGATLNIDGVEAFYRMTWLADWADHVTYTHEMGHGFGLPHSSGPYGAVYDSNWDVMSGSWTNHDSEWGWLAPHTISYHKNLLGWIPADRVHEASPGSTSTITLHRLADLGAGGDYLMARVPRPDGTFYTVEARRFVGYDENLPAQAVILHHVSGRAFVVDPDGNGNPDDDGARWLPGETFEDEASGVTVTVEAQTAEGFVVTIAVAEPGHIELSPAALAFAAPQGADPDPGALTIRNTGIGELQWSATDDAMWLELAAAAGSAARGDSSMLGVAVRSGELAPGSYDATITVAGNADNAPQTVPVTLDVSAAPVLAVLAEPLQAEAVVGTDPPGHEVLVRNAGAEELDWSASADVPWLAFRRGAGTLAPGASETDTIEISTAGLDVGSYAGTVTFDGNASNAPVVLEAALVITPPPSIALGGAIAFDTWDGVAADARVLTVTNDGQGTLQWTASSDEGWVVLERTSGALPAGATVAIEVRVAGDGLAPGSHTASVTVTGNADDSPQVAAVTLELRAAPVLAAQDVADHLLGVRATLDAAELEYLDAAGNGNEAFDVGDFRAWLQGQGLVGRLRPGDGGEVTP